MLRQKPHLHQSGGASAGCASAGGASAGGASAGGAAAGGGVHLLVAHPWQSHPHYVDDVVPFPHLQGLQRLQVVSPQQFMCKPAKNIHIKVLPQIL